MNNQKRKIRMLGVWIVLASLLSGGFGQSAVLQAKLTVKAKLSAGSVKVGSRIQVIAKTSNVSFSSSNTKVASVDSQGFITGKKKGKLHIYVKKKGYQTKKLSLTVKENGRKPKTLPVTFSEVSIGKKGNNIYIANHSKHGKIKKITYYIEMEHIVMANRPVSGSAITTGVHRYKVSLTVSAKNIAAGKSVSAVCKGSEDLLQSIMESPTKIEMYTGNALYVFDRDKKTYTFQWGTKDTTAPRITGYIGKRSQTGHGDCYRACYSDKKNSYNFKQFVSATDDRDGKVNLKVDTSKINWNKQGIYKIYYHATDRAGNKKTAWAKIQVLKPGSAESAADQVLRSITRNGWSDTKKAKAIYKYVRGHLSYVQNSSHVHWQQAGLRALRYQSGDCYTYYALSRLLLTRAGIPNVMINRYPTPGGQRHFWNLAYVQGGWYHFDTTPRRRKENFCLWTDAQLHGYSSGYTFRFKESLYPKRSARKIA